MRLRTYRTNRLLRGEGRDGARRRDVLFPVCARQVQSPVAQLPRQLYVRAT